MAKMIKCPTCLTPIEINPQALGQVVKCPGCGKGIKLVAKKSSNPPQSSGAGYAAAMNSGSLSGETARSFMGEPALTGDEPPKLDSTCPRCGRFTDEADLIEDEGEMVCKECAIASAAEKSGGAIEDYAPAPYVPSKRGNIINLTPMFFAFCFFAVVLGASQIYLNMIGVPTAAKKVAKANIVSHPNTPAPAPAATSPAEPVKEPEVVTPPATNESAEDKADAEWEQQNKDDITMRFNKANQAFAEGKKDEAEQLYKDAFKFIEGHKVTDTTINSTVATAAKLWASMHATPTPAPAPEPAPAASQPTAEATPPPTEAQLANNPIAQGLDALKKKDYTTAARIFEDQRLKLLRPPIPPTLSNDQAVVLVGKAAADLGRGRAEDGRPAIDLAYNKNVRTRAAILNRAMIYLGSHASIKDLIDATKSVRGVVEGSSDYDDLGSNVLGMLLDRLSSMSLNQATRAEVVNQQKFLDEYTGRYSDKHEGKLKWGIDWLPAEDVKRYRLLKGSVQDTALTQLYRQLEIAKAKVSTAQKAYDAASKAGGNTSIAKAQLDTANEAEQQVQTQIDNAKQAVQPQRWIENFEPVVPDAPQT